MINFEDLFPDGIEINIEANSEFQKKHGDQLREISERLRADLLGFYASKLAPAQVIERIAIHHGVDYQLSGSDEQGQVDLLIDIPGVGEQSYSGEREGLVAKQLFEQLVEDEGQDRADECFGLSEGSYQKTLGEILGADWRARLLSE